VRRHAGEQGPSLRCAKRGARKDVGGHDAERAEARREQRVARRPGLRREHELREAVPLARERPDQRAVGAGVGAERLRGLLERAVQRHRGAAVERVRSLDWRLEQLEPVFVQRQAGEERRAERERVNRRADVVVKAGDRQLGRAGAAADRLGALDHVDGAPAARQLDRGGQAVGPGAYDDRVYQGRRVAGLPAAGAALAVRSPSPGYSGVV